MKRFRWFFRTGVLLWAIGAISLGLAGEAVAADATDGNINFFWSFVAKTSSNGSPTLVPITRDTVLKTGDQIQMMVELREKCFVYLFYKSTDGDMHLLFPYAFGQFDAGYGAPAKYFMPKDKSRMYTLNESTGFETFYLLASEKRLKSLEDLYTRHMALTTMEEKGASVQKSVAERRTLRKKHKKFRTSAERPLIIGGAIRGDIEDHKVAIEAETFYGRSFTIDHK